RRRPRQSDLNQRADALAILGSVLAEARLVIRGCFGLEDHLTRRVDLGERGRELQLVDACPGRRQRPRRRLHDRRHLALRARAAPTVCEPSASGTMRAATAAAEPDEEPPGVCSTFHGLRVGAGSRYANWVVCVFPSTIAPLLRSACTDAASRVGRVCAHARAPA